MLKAKLYAGANSVQRHDSEEVIEEFSKVMQWRLDGKDTLLDVGTGSGDVLMDFLYPIVPGKFKTIIGSDISANMVQYCKKTYKSRFNKVDFKILDIGIEKLPKKFVCKFDHVTSFYCLNWVQNLQQAVRNIYQILHFDGDCLLVFLAEHQFFDIYKTLSKTPKWAPYMKDVDLVITPFQYSKDPGMIFRRMLKDEGFSDYIVEVREKIFVYDNLDIMKKNVRAVNPFIERMPKDMQIEHIDEIVRTSISLKSSESIGIDDYRFNIPYKLLVAYARK